MILIAYGDELAAAAYTSVNYAWANQDNFEIHKGLRAHPLNIPHGFAYKTSVLMHCGFHSAAYRESMVDVFIKDFEKNKPLDQIAVVASWSKAHTGELKKIEEFGRYLISEKIPVCFINHENTLKSSGPFWLWNPAATYAKAWAHKNKYLSSNGFINSFGHTILANHVLLHLTNQIPNIIIQE